MSCTFPHCDCDDCLHQRALVLTDSIPSTPDKSGEPTECDCEGCRVHRARKIAREVSSLAPSGEPGVPNSDAENLHAGRNPTGQWESSETVGEPGQKSVSSPGTEEWHSQTWSWGDLVGLAVAARVNRAAFEKSLADETTRAEMWRDHASAMTTRAETAERERDEARKAQSDTAHLYAEQLDRAEEAERERDWWRSIGGPERSALYQRLDASRSIHPTQTD